MLVDHEINLNVPEQWKQFGDTPYYVSDQGRVKRIYKNGRISYLKPVPRGYGSGNSVRVKILRKYYILNKLVWEVFRGPVPDGYTVVNKYGYLKINDVYSLRLIPIREAVKKGMPQKGRPVIDLNTGMVYPSGRVLAKMLNKPHTTINNWIARKYKSTPKRFECYDENKKYKMTVRFVRGGRS